MPDLKSCNTTRVLYLREWPVFVYRFLLMNRERSGERGPTATLHKQKHMIGVARIEGQTNPAEVDIAKE